MAPQKRFEGPITAHVNNHGFPALADEIYLEIISYIPSVPVPSNNPPLYNNMCRPRAFSSLLFPRTRRSRHETLFSLSQTCRSLRRFFWRYLWQRIEVREGMKIGDENKTLQGIDDPYDRRGDKNYAIELVRQLEIVTVRNPQLAQYVNYLDVFIGEYSIDTVLPELAHCLTLFSNLHTVQIDVRVIFRSRRRSLRVVFEKAFKKYSYPQIRNVFIMSLSQSFLASCPQARHVGYTQRPVCLDTVANNCPHLEILGQEFGELFSAAAACKLVVDKFPNLRTITISPLIRVGHPSNITIFSKLNHLQTITVFWRCPGLRFIAHLSPKEQVALINKAKEDWIDSVKHVLLQIQLRDNLEKTIIIRHDDSEGETKIVFKQIVVT